MFTIYLEDRREQRKTPIAPADPWNDSLNEDHDSVPLPPGNKK